MAQEERTFRDSKLNVLAVCAFIVVVLCLVVTVWLKITDEFAKGIITLILGRYLGYIDNIYSFEFGTTRNSKNKDDVITNLASASPHAPSQVRDAVVGAVSGPSQEAPVPVVNLHAETVNLNEPSKGAP